MATGGPEADRRLQWAGCLNARDLGGLPTADGRRLRSAALIRSDSPHWLSEEGVAAALTVPVRRVLDLRSAAEVELDPSPFASSPTYRLLPLIDPSREHERDPESERSHATTYIGSLRRNRGRIAEAVAEIADAPDGAVLVHCHSGKDRTGIVVALALRVVGVDPEHIAADYALSADCLQERSDAWLAEIDDEQQRERERAMTRTDPQTMVEFLRALDEQYGGAETYLRDSGVSATQLDRLRGRLLDQVD